MPGAARITLRAMTRLVQIEATSFAEAFARRSVYVRHALVDHPLFTLEAIADLADHLPRDSVRRERGHLPFINTDGYVDVGEGPPSETVLGIEDNGFRISLRDIQQAPEYARLINECLDEVDALVAHREGGMRRRAGYLFISAAGGDDADALRRRAQLPAADQGHEARQRRGLRPRPGRCSSASATAISTASAATSRRCRQVADDLPASSPGVGVYLPSYVPHWVETEAGVSVSFSIPFFTAFAERAETVHRINRRMRKLHLSPRPPGASEALDRTKATAARSWEKLRDARRRQPA